MWEKVLIPSEEDGIFNADGIGRNSVPPGFL
jgi:hypothetical protein